MAGFEGAASASFLALLAPEGLGAGGKARPPAPLWPPAVRSSPTFPSLLSLSPSSEDLLAPCSTGKQQIAPLSSAPVAQSKKVAKVRNSGLRTHKLQHIPVKNIVIGESLSVEQIPEELTEVRVVRLVIKSQGAAQIQVSGELGWGGAESWIECGRKQRSHLKAAPSSLTGVPLAEHLDGRGHFLLADAFILLSLGSSLEALPGQRAQVEVHEHVAKGLQVVPSGLLCGGQKSVNLVRALRDRLQAELCSPMPR